MKAVLRFIAAHNFIPITGAFTCYRYFSTLNNQPADYFFIYGAAFFCWLFYFIDKLRDNRLRIFSSTERHYLSASDKKIQWLTGAFLAFLTLLNLHSISIQQFLVFSALIPVSVIYLMVANSYSNHFKEVFSSLIIAFALCLLPVLLNGTFKDLNNFPVFFSMILGNMLLMGIIDLEYDLLHGFNSLAVYFGKRKMITVFLSLLFALLPITFYINPENAFWVITYCVLYLVLLIFREKLSSVSLHILSDLIFLYPLIR